MYKVVTKDQHGKEHGTPVHEQTLQGALFAYGLCKAGDGVTNGFYETKDENGRKKREAIVLTTSILELDGLGGAIDVTPNSTPRERELARKAEQNKQE